MRLLRNLHSILHHATVLMTGLLFTSLFSTRENHEVSISNFDDTLWVDAEINDSPSSSSFQLLAEHTWLRDFYEFKSFFKYLTHGPNKLYPSITVFKYLVL